MITLSHCQRRFRIHTNGRKTLHQLRKLITSALAVTALGLSTYGFAASDLATVQEKKLIRLGAVEAAPWYTKDLLSNEWKGLVPDVMDAIFAGSGIKISYVDTQWGTAVAGLQSDRFDLLGAYNSTPERRKAIDFSESMGELKFAVLSLKKPAPDYSTWDLVDTPAMHLAAVDGAGATAALQPLLTHLQWLMMPSSDAMFMQMESARADALVTSDIQIAQYLQRRHQGQMSIPTPVRSQSTNIGLRKSDDPKLREWLDSRLAQLKADGTLDRIWSKYTASAQ
jgi:polar amino acid transport system substrate-binding protein